MSGDVERDAELFDDEERYPPHLRRPPAKVLSINQLVSYNMWRARRAKDWSQQDVAELLEKYTGRAWSNASVSAAERAWQGGRPRRFDASEIVALARIFEQPIIYFFMPDENGNYYADTVGMREFADGIPNTDSGDKDNDLMALLPTIDYVHSIGLYQTTPQFTFRMQVLVSRFAHLTWEPPTWKVPLKIYDPREILEGYPASTKEEGKQVQKEGEKLSLGDNMAITTNPDTGERVINLTVTKEELVETIRNVTQEVMQKAFGVSGGQTVRPPSDSDMLEDE